MTLLFQQWESNASRRVVPLWCVQSNGTTPAANESGGQPQFMVGGVYKGNTSGTLSVSSAARGEYFVTLTASELSLTGQGAVYFSSTTALEVSANFQVVAFDPYGQNLQVSSGRTLFAGSTATATLNSAETGTNDWANGAFIAVQLHSGLVVGNIISDSTGTVVQFLNSFPAAPASGDTYVILPGTSDNFSGLSIAPAPGDYGSTVTVGVDAIKAQTYSGVTVGSAATILAATYSGVTVGTNNIAAGTYSGVTTSGFDSAGNQAVANSLLSTNLGNSRLVQEALFAMRNKVDATGSVGTVYKTDDATSAFTFSTSTGAFPFSKIDPA